MKTTPQHHTSSKLYFDIQNLDEIASLEAHISFAEALISAYEWDADTADRFRFELEAIRSKQRDKQLNLTVVGEFSTGKSTFINAMLRRDDFLVSSALQGTTVAATVIEHASTYGLEWINDRGQTTGKTFDSVDTLKAGLVAYTSDPAVAKGLRHVRILLPSSSLAAGFRIIDTPGTNVTEAWHEKVTIRTIREMSDMAILIIDAGKPLSQSFCDFIKLHLGGMLQTCIFVATRMDMIRARERDGVLAYLRQKISAEFDLPDPIVLPYSSIEVLDSLGAESPSALAAQSFQSEVHMLQHMTRLKMIAQTQKLISLINALYAAVSDRMLALSHGYRDELDLLIKTQHTDLKPFIQQKIIETCQHFQSDVREKRAQFTGQMDKLSQKAYKNVMKQVNACDTIDKLKSFTSDGLSACCYREAQKLLHQGEATYSLAYDAFCCALQQFQLSFEKLFEDLDILNVDFDAKTYVVPQSPPIRTANLEVASQYIAEQLSKENKAYLGGAAAGAAIGTAIAPGIGTIIGGLIGFIGGAAAAPNLEEVKKNTKDKLQPPLRKYFLDVVQAATAGFDDYTHHIQNHNIPSEINKYLSTYQQTVSSQLAQERERIASVEKKLAQLKTDIEGISMRKFTLESLHNQLNQLYPSGNNRRQP